VNIKTGIDASASAANPAGDRKTITVVGGLLIGCFTIAFVLIGYLLFQRRPKKRFFNKKGNNNSRNNTDLAGLADIGSGSADSSSPEEEDNGEEFEGTNAFARHFDLDQGGEDNNNTSRSSNNDRTDEEGDQHHHGCDDEVLLDDEPPTTPKKKKGMGLKKNIHYISPASKGEEQEQEYADLPISNEAIRMDLGNSLKGQLMGLHGSITNNGPYGRKKSIGGSFDQRGIIDPGQGATDRYHHQPNEDDTDRYQHQPNHSNSPGGGGNRSFNNSVDGNDSDVDSWAQTEGTIGSLELQLDPITAEV